MNRLKIIKEIIGSRINPYGFKYLRYTHNRWTFRRTVDGVDQDIVIAKCIHSDNELRIEICTSVQQLGLEIRWITDNPKYAQKIYWKYENDEEYIRILEEFSDIMVKYCINKLDEISVPIHKYSPTPEMHYKLYNQNKDLVKDYIRKKGYTIEQVNIGLALDSVVEAIQKNKGKKYEEVQDEFVEVSALYGTEMIHRYGGEWKYYNLQKVCAIIKMKGAYSTCNLLRTIVECWEEDNVEYIIEIHTKRNQSYEKLSN